MISTYWMVKNDKRGLVESIGKVRELGLADEFVVLDTGSTDGTVEAARDALSGMNGTPVTIEQRRYAEPLHFGDARNDALALCRQEWILQLDSDEFVTSCDVEALRTLLRDTPRGVLMYRIPFQLTSPDGQHMGQTMLPRLFRKGVRYKFGYHEVPDVPAEASAETRLLQVKHWRGLRDAAVEAARDEQRGVCSDRWLRELKERSPDDRWRAMMYLGIDLVRRGKLDEAVVELRDALDTLKDTGPNPFVYQIAHYLAATLNRLGRCDEALEIGQRYVGYDVTRNELAIDLGDSLVGAGLRVGSPNMVDRGRQWYEYAAAFRGLPLSNLFVEVPSHTYVAPMKLCDWYLRFAVSPEIAKRESTRWYREAVSRGLPPQAAARVFCNTISWEINGIYDGVDRKLRERGLRVENSYRDADVIVTDHSPVEVAEGVRVVRFVDDGSPLIGEERYSHVVVPDWETGQKVAEATDGTQLVHIVPDDEHAHVRFLRILRRPGIHIAHTGQHWQIEQRMREVLPVLGCCHAPIEAAEVVINCQPGFDRSKMRAGARLVFWNTEWLEGDDRRQQERRELWAAEAAQSDVHLSVMDGTSPYPGGACWPFMPDGKEPDIDVLHYGLTDGRRREMLEALRSCGVRIHEVQTFDAEELARWICRAKLVLNLHYYDGVAHEFRLWESLSCATPVLSEPLPEWSPLAEHVDVLPWDAESWAERIAETLADEEARQLAGMAGAEWCWKNFRLDQNLEKVLDRAGVV